jgi:hypothetical protein
MGNANIDVWMAQMDYDFESFRVISLIILFPKSKGKLIQKLIMSEGLFDNCFSRFKPICQ